MSTIKLGNKMKYNPASHFYLYAKGWYEKTDLESDLKKIMAYYSAVDYERVDMRDLKLFLTTLCYKEILRKSNGEHTFVTFVSHVAEGNLLNACITILALSENDYELPLLKPNENILPFSESGRGEVNSRIWANTFDEENEKI